MNHKTLNKIELPNNIKKPKAALADNFSTKSANNISHFSYMRNAYIVPSTTAALSFKIPLQSTFSFRLICY